MGLTKRIWCVFNYSGANLIALLVWHVILWCPWRTALLVVLVACLEATYILEQPENSVITLHHRLLWAFRVLRKKANVRAPRRIITFSLDLLDHSFLFVHGRELLP